MNRIIRNFRGWYLIFLPVLIFSIGSLVGCCEKTAPVFEYGKATVVIEQQSLSTISGFTVLFTPSENATSFYYSIGTAEDADMFENAELETVEVMGNAPESVTFDNLDPNKEYAIFAKAYDEAGLAGSTAMYLVSTADDTFNVIAEYVGNDNAGILVNYSSSRYASVEYYLGEPSDYEAFMNGSIKTTSFETALSGTTVFNYLTDLLPSHTYTVYCRAVGLKGETEIRTLDFTTCANGENADVTFTYENDVYKGLYTMTANDNCARMDVLYSRRGQFLNTSNDIVETMSRWASSGFNVVTVTDKVYNYEYITSNLQGGQQLEAWVVCYNHDMQPETVRYFPISTPSNDPEAPECTVTVEVSDVTAKGATIKYTPDENTKFFVYEVVRGWWYDEQIEKNPNFDLWGYMDMNVNLPPITVYVKELPDGTFTFTEEGCEPGKKYYAAAFPMNKNGRYGRQKPVLVPFETKAQ